MKKGEHKGRTTPRGFADYGLIVDGRGNTITVRQSSSAEGHYVWLFVKNVAGANGVFHLGEWQSASPHMGVREARMLIEALERFIKATPQ